MSLEPGLVDANVLVSAINADAAQHSASRTLSESALDGSVALYVTSQVLCEFYSVVTNKRRVSSPLSSSEAEQTLSSFLQFLPVLPTTAKSVDILASLLRRRPVIGGEVFDLQIVATMKANGVLRIYTFNVADFQPFSELEILVPLS